MSGSAFEQIASIFNHLSSRQPLWHADLSHIKSRSCFCLFGSTQPFHAFLHRLGMALAKEAKRAPRGQFLAAVRPTFNFKHSATCCESFTVSRHGRMMAVARTILLRLLLLIRPGTRVWNIQSKHLQANRNKTVGSTRPSGLDLAYSAFGEKKGSPSPPTPPELATLSMKARLSDSWNKRM